MKLSDHLEQIKQQEIRIKDLNEAFVVQLTFGGLFVASYLYALVRG